VREKLHLGGPVFRGVQAVPLDKIVGSVDRYRDFDRMFLPTQSHTSERWRKISRARYQDISLPPVLLFKVGEVYFVVDGNHRVSVAREAGQEYIDAEVREVISRVPVTADVGADDLECLEERVQFLERTQLDRLHPEAVIKPTIVGGYDRLIEHIAVHCYFMGIDQGRSPSEEEAVNDWYDTLYRPVVEVVRETGVLDEFPGRTETDLYLWIMDHLLPAQPRGRDRPGRGRCRLHPVARRRLAPPSQDPAKCRGEAPAFLAWLQFGQSGCFAPYTASRRRLIPLRPTPRGVFDPYRLTSNLGFRSPPRCSLHRIVMSAAGLYSGAGDDRGATRRAA
jgi:hypothetical protein